MPWYANDEGETLWYEDRGDGPPIVLLHGWCMSSAVWRLQLAGLSTSFRVIAPDLRGHGRSSRSSSGYSLEGFAKDIASLFRHLCLEGTLLVGWSLGAQVALQLYAQVREQLSALALVSATPRFIATGNFPWALGAKEAEGMSLKIRRSTVRAWDGFIKGMFAAGELDDPLLAAEVHELFAAIPAPDTGIAVQSLHTLVEADMRNLLTAIDLPTLIVNGDRDVICLPGASDYLEEKIMSSSRVVIHGCGHAPFLTRNMVFDTCLTDFMRRILERNK